MLDLAQIAAQYPQPLSGFKRNILREYIQYKILELIFNSKYANRLSFMGGTALRIIYNTNRFSEDLDFDNFNLTESDFIAISKEVEKGLTLEGYQVELVNVCKGAYRCKVKFPNILFDNKLSDIKDEKILIQLDTQEQGFLYTADKKIINKFDVFSQVFVTPLDILLSQKIWAVFNRKRAKGRDFFDITFLLTQTTPNYEYLKLKLNIDNALELRAKILERCAEIDFELLVNDVKPFLFYPKDSVRITLFKEFIKDVKL